MGALSKKIVISQRTRPNPLEMIMNDVIAADYSWLFRPLSLRHENLTAGDIVFGFLAFSPRVCATARRRRQISDVKNEKPLSTFHVGALRTSRPFALASDWIRQGFGAEKEG